MPTEAPFPADVLADMLAGAWLDINPRVDRPVALGARWRHSNAGKCSRYLQYDLNGVEKSEPLGYSSRWVFKMGDHAHNELQAALMELFDPDCILEWEGESVWMDGSLHSDAHVTLANGNVVVFEIKSINGFGYKKAIGATSSTAEGARHDAKLQAAMNAASTPGCIGAYVVYGALEAVSVGQADKYNLSDRARTLMVWWLPIEECVALATPEYERMNAIGAWMDEHQIDKASVDEQPLIPARSRRTRSPRTRASPTRSPGSGPCSATATPSTSARPGTAPTAPTRPSAQATGPAKRDLPAGHGWR
jgi:hypothetical protein